RGSSSPRRHETMFLRRECASLLFTIGPADSTGYPLNAAPRAPLSAVLITRNAAAVLAPCLESLAFADEIVVVDSGSSDGTAEIGGRYGARLVQKEWLGFGRQKQYAVDQARHDWVLCLDADE